MIKHSGLVGEPRGGPGIAGTKAPPGLNRFESFLVAAVEAQSNSKVKMAESKVSVQLDRTASMRYGGPDVASPMACLREHILGLRVFAIERHSLKSGRIAEMRPWLWLTNFLGLGFVAGQLIAWRQLRGSSPR